MIHPFTSTPEKQIATCGEVELLERIRAWLGTAAPATPHGMGDDTAVLPDGTGNLLTTDSLVYGRHFDDTLSPEAAGAKLLKRSLSDIAAMGGQPQGAVLAGFMPPRTSLEWTEGFVRGLAACAIEWSVSIVGGDLTETTDFLGFNLTLTGSAKRPLLRATAAVGDDIYVTGELGHSLAGHHASFIPRLPEGQWLALENEVHSMIDVTDGLGKDLPALLPPGTAAALDLNALPLRVGVQEIEQAFVDGEDYELLFSASPSWSEAGGPRRWSTTFETRLTCIGKIITAEADGCPLLDLASREPLRFGSGYVHFG